MSRLRQFLSRMRAPAPEPIPAAVTPLPEGPLYAVGDIHGHAERFDRLEQAILDDARSHGADHAHIVTLGDYVDRGPDSAGVLDRLTGTAPPGIARTCLMGNHEVMFAQFLHAPDPRSAWLDMSGRETLASYGLYTDRLAAAPRHFAASVHAMIPTEHVTFLDTLPLAASTPTHFLCHAGVDPARPLDAQTEQALLWIREPFLSHDAPLEKIVVHGHTPTAQPDLRGWRINVDTGAYSGGPLSAVRLDAQAAPHIVQVD